MKSFSQAGIERLYRSWAKVYDSLTPYYILGNEPRLRRETIDALQLRPGQRVLDIACGTGRNFPLILEKIGPEGKLVGVDYTDAMLARARFKVERAGWNNVELIQADATRLHLQQSFDAALCTLAIGVIPDPRAALERMLAYLKPGGRLAIGDGKRSSRSYRWAFNWWADLIGYGAGEIMTRRPWEALPPMVADYRYEEWFSGYFYVASGQKSPRSL